MKIYNKKKTSKTYSNEKGMLVLPSATNDGERGPVVEIDARANRVLAQSWRHVLADYQAGNIEIEK